MLRIEKVSKIFGQAIAVDGVTLEIDRPGMIGLIGGSGAGKSALLRVIGSLEPPSSGRVLFEGREVTGLKGQDRQAWRAQCVMIAPQRHMTAGMDVASCLLHGTAHQRQGLPAPFGFHRAARLRRAAGILERLEVAAHAAKRVEALSGAQRQRVAIACALMQDPAVLLADEPMASLDPLNARSVMQSLRHICEEDGRTVIASLPAPEAARRYCVRVIGMRGGRIVFDGPPEALTPAAAREIYGAGRVPGEAAESPRERSVNRAAQAVFCKDAAPATVVKLAPVPPAAGSRAARGRAAPACA